MYHVFVEAADLDKASIGVSWYRDAVRISKTEFECTSIGQAARCGCCSPKICGDLCKLLVCLGVMVKTSLMLSKMS